MLRTGYFCMTHLTLSIISEQCMSSICDIPIDVCSPVEHWLQTLLTSSTMFKYAIGHIQEGRDLNKVCTVSCGNIIFRMFFAERTVELKYSASRMITSNRRIDWSSFTCNRTIDWSSFTCNRTIDWSSFTCDDLIT